jgi:leucyl/phenylalanyl-tRNA---protein transferase
MFSLRHPPRSLAELRNDLTRVGLGIAYSLRPKRVSALPHIAIAGIRRMLRLDPPDSGLDSTAPLAPGRQGFVDFCGPLEPERLMRGFRKGLFPFSHVGPKKWWMHPQRMTIVPHLIKREKDVRRLLRSKRFRITFDHDFEAVMRACAEPRKGHVPLTWITEDIIEGYVALHRAGHAHSFEAWSPEGELAGGGFGIAVGPVFVIESQFTRQRNASKVAMATIMRHLSAWGFTLADGKAHTSHLEALGFELIPHEDFVAAHGDATRAVGPVGRWSVDESLDASIDWEPAAEPARPEAAPSVPEAPSSMSQFHDAA